MGLLRVGLLSVRMHHSILRLPVRTAINPALPLDGDYQAAASSSIPMLIEIDALRHVSASPRSVTAY